MLLNVAKFSREWKDAKMTEMKTEWSKWTRIPLYWKQFNLSVYQSERNGKDAT